jgi:hypothetical protein
MAAEDAAAQTGVVAEVPDLGEIPAPNDKGPSPEPPGFEPMPAEAPQEEKAEAALAEKKDANHKVAFTVGEPPMEVQCPPKMPASFKFRIGALDDNDPAVLRVIRKLIGDEQWEEMMDRMDEADLFDEDGPNSEADNALGDFVQGIMKTYGVTPGESQASQKS